MSWFGSGWRTGASSSSKSQLDTDLALGESITDRSGFVILNLAEVEEAYAQAGATRQKQLSLKWEKGSTIILYPYQSLSDRIPCIKRASECRNWALKNKDQEIAGRGANPMGTMLINFIYFFGNWIGKKSFKRAGARWKALLSRKKQQLFTQMLEEEVCDGSFRYKSRKLMAQLWMGVPASVSKEYDLEAREAAQKWP